MAALRAVPCGLASVDRIDHCSAQSICAGHFADGQASLQSFNAGCGHRPGSVSRPRALIVGNASAISRGDIA
jgi:hypothetical protein